MYFYLKHNCFTVLCWFLPNINLNRPNFIGVYLLFPCGVSGKEPACQCRRPKARRFDSWVWKILWRKAWQPTPVFLPAESHGQRILAAYSP